MSNTQHKWRVAAQLPTLLVLALLALLPTNLLAENGDTFSDENLNYKIISETDLTVEVIGLNKTSSINAGAVKTLPSMVEFEGQSYTVVAIGQRAFVNEELVEMTIPNTVTNIGAAAFQHCVTLKEVHIPESVTEIGVSAFSNCSALQSATIPEGVTVIEESTFIECSNLATVTIPGTVTSIGANAFARCSSLTELILPASVTNIGLGAFGNCTGLKVVASLAVIPPALGSIVFYNVPTQTIPLYVPGESIEAYKAADQWKDFMFIDDIITGIDDIYTETLPAPAEYFNLHGVRVDRPACGVYIKRRGSKVAKVLVD